MIRKQIINGHMYLSSNMSTEIQGNNIGLNASTFASNYKINEYNYGKFIGRDLSCAITNFRQNNVSIQSQI